MTAPLESWVDSAGLPALKTIYFKKESYGSGPYDEVVEDMSQSTLEREYYKRKLLGTLPGGLDAQVSGLIGDEDSNVRQQLDYYYPLKSHRTFNLWDYGLKEPGVTDSAALTAALLALKGSFNQGGTLECYPATELYLSTQIEISNVLFDMYGTHIYRTGTGAVGFRSLQADQPGYGSGGNSVRFKGITFHGDFRGIYGSVRGIGVIMHHVDVVEAEDCIFDQAIVNGHLFDLMGCRAIRFIRCRFRGAITNVAGRNYVEAIQLDHSSQGGAGGSYVENSACWDGLPCKDVVMYDCHSEPLTLDGITYPAPRLIGSHSRVEGRYHENIYLDKISVTDSTTTVGDQNYRGWVHFILAKNVRIGTYEVNINSNLNVVALGFGSVPTVYPLSSVADSSPTLVNGRHSCSNIIVENLIVNGNSTMTELSSLLVLSGGVDVPIRNVSATVSAYGCSTNDLVNYDTGATMVDISTGHSINLDLKCDGVRRMVNVESSRHIHSKLRGRNVTHSGIRAITVRDITTDAKLYDVTCAGYFSGVVMGSTVGSQIYLNGALTVPYTGAFNYTSCSYIKSGNNQIISDQGSAVTKANSWYGTTTKSSSIGDQSNIPVNVVDANSTVTLLTEVLLT